MCDPGCSRARGRPPSSIANSFEQYIERFRKKRLKLLRPLRDKSVDGIQKERLAVTRTWPLNIESSMTNSAI
jgi:hypothetical protein